MQVFRRNYPSPDVPTENEEKPSTKRVSLDDYFRILTEQMGQQATVIAEIERRTRQAKSRSTGVTVTVADFGNAKAVPEGDWQYVLVNRPGVGERSLTTLQSFRFQLGNRYYTLPASGLSVFPYMGEQDFTVTTDPVSGSTAPTGNWSIEAIFTNRDIASLTSSSPETPAGGVLAVQGAFAGGDIAIQPLLPTASLSRAFDGAVWGGVRAPRAYRSASASAAGATAVWTPFGGSVTVGTNPRGVGITPDGAFAYVANNGAGTVSVIAIATNTVVATVTVGPNPYGVGITPDGAYAYIANYGTTTVSVIATATNTVVATVTVGAGPVGVGITPDGAYAYVANYGAGTVSVIATATNTVVATVTVGANPQGVGITPDGAYAYITNYGAGTVSVIATATNTVVARRFRLLRAMFVLTAEAAQTTAGEITIKLQDGTTDTGISLPIYVPAAAIAAPIGEAWTSPWIDLGPLGYLSNANGNVLNVNLSAALTAGKIGVIVGGTEEL